MITSWRRCSTLGCGAPADHEPPCVPEAVPPVALVLSLGETMGEPVGESVGEHLPPPPPLPREEQPTVRPVAALVLDSWRAEIASLRAQVEGLTAERDHYRLAAGRRADAEPVLRLHDEARAAEIEAAARSVLDAEDEYRRGMCLGTMQAAADARARLRAALARPA